MPRTLIAIALCSAAMIWADAPIAVAQPAGPAPAAQPAPPPAPAAPAEPTPEQKKLARDKFLEGRKAFAAKDYTGALEALRASYAMVPSPNSHLMIVHALTEMGRDTEAWDEAVLVAAEAQAAAAANPKYAQTAQAAQEEMDRLKQKLGLVSVDVRGVAAPGGEAQLIVQGRTIRPDLWSKPIAVKPGPVRVELNNSVGTATRSVAVRAGGTVRVVIRAREPGVPDDPGPPPEPIDAPGEEEDGGTVEATLGWVGLGIGAAGMLSFGIFGGLTLSEFSKLEEQCPANDCPAANDGDADSGRTYQVVANVSLVVGLVGLVGGGTLLLLDTLEDDGDEDGDDSPTVAVGPGSVVISGTF
jgi:hypothetical protein